MMTVAPVFNQTQRDLILPYITRDQYRCAPTAQDTQALIRGGTQADQDAELDRLILQASGWCDNMAEQPLTAQLTTEVMRVPVAAGGVLRLHPRQSPLVSVNGISYGADASLMSTMTDLSGVWVEDQAVLVPLQAVIASGFTGPLQFGSARPGNRLRVVFQYVAGFTCTTLAVAAAATASTVTVVDSTGLAPGMMLRFEQGGAPTGQGSAQAGLVQTRGVVQSVAGNVVTLTAPIGLAFGAGAAATTMPPDVTQAAVYATTALIKQQGTGALVMGGKSATVKGAGDGEHPGLPELDEAEAILALYRPVAP